MVPKSCRLVAETARRGFPIFLSKALPTAFLISNLKKKRGILISFEGSEGCGKTTQIRRLVPLLRQRGYRVTALREPGGTRLGERIRHLLQFAKDGEGLTAETELLLFSASRAQLVRERIIPALQEGHIVISDRFIDSTLVYQGYARGLDLDLIQRLNDFATDGLKPDLTLLLQAPDSLGLRRARGKTRRRDRMEFQAASFYRAVEKGFRRLAKMEPQRVRVIPQRGGISQITELIWQQVEPLLSEKFVLLRRSGSLCGNHSCS